jgi:hypothetical protein
VRGSAAGAADGALRHAEGKPAREEATDQRHEGEIDVRPSGRRNPASQSQRRGGWLLRERRRGPDRAPPRPTTDTSVSVHRVMQSGRWKCPKISVSFREMHANPPPALPRAHPSVH